MNEEAGKTRSLDNAEMISVCLAMMGGLIAFGLGGMLLVFGLCMFASLQVRHLLERKSDK